MEGFGAECTFYFNIMPKGGDFIKDMYKKTTEQPPFFVFIPVCLYAGENYT